MRIAGKWRLEEVNMKNNRIFTSHKNLKRCIFFLPESIRSINFFMLCVLFMQCHPSGCLTDLFIQMAIIMVLKQTVSNVFEFAGP